jgi:hypothetical protein
VTHLQPQLSAHHNHARTTDVLLDDERLTDWRQLALNKIEAQGARRASGRGIFGDADTWKKAARVSRRRA